MDIDTAPPAYESFSEPVEPLPSDHQLSPMVEDLPRNSPILKVEATLEFKVEPEHDVKPESEYLSEPLIKQEHDAQPEFEDISGLLIEQESDSDGDYERIHSGYDIKDESRVG